MELGIVVIGLFVVATPVAMIVAMIVEILKKES